MEVFHKIADYNIWRSRLKEKGFSIGFVATMGALHEGHLSLIKASQKENDVTVCSIFVNPTQFNKKNDFEKYPRILKEDSLKLDHVNCNALFAPETDEMYPNDANGGQADGIELGSLAEVMEGEFRPGHFDGVVSIVSKLFRIIDPDRAYFGLKDYQQLAVVRTMNKKLNLGVEVIGCPTVREPDGLALSSRNLLLSKEQRSEASSIFRSMQKGKEQLDNIDVESFKRIVIDGIEDSPTLNVEYVEVSDSNSLHPLSDWNKANSAVCCVAVHAGDVRLIDNIILYN